MKRILSSVFLLAVLLCPLTMVAQPAVPQLQQRVTDFTNTLNFNQWRALESRLKQFEDSTSTQVAIVMVNSLEGDAIEDFSMRIFEKNKLGQKGKDNGVLVLVAKADHKARIEVGYGLEGALTDALTTQIREREMNPRFRSGDFYGGLDATITAIIAATAGEYKVDARGKRAPLTSVILALFFFGFMGAFVLPMFSSRRKYVIGSRGSVYRSGWGWPYIGGGGGFGGGGGGFGGFGGGGGFSGGGGMAGGGGSSGSW
ncbi:MAG TPA: TPM domain-containing protein [Bacteroidota bacterium]|nr:TPM domain-containing protein [Bacteroidota bacterium]